MGKAIGKWENHGKSHRKMEVYSLGNVYITIENRHVIARKTQYFDWAILNSKLLDY